MANAVERILIEGLYDTYNYDITFKEDGVTLITGPNGFGKTTILKIIKNSLEQNFMYFYGLLFRRIILYFDKGEHGTRLELEKNKAIKRRGDFSDETNESELHIKFYYYANNKHTNESLCINSDFITKSLYRKFPEKEVENYSTQDLSQIDNRIMQSFNYFQLFLNDQKCLFVQEQRIFLDTLKDSENKERYTIRLHKENEKKYTISKLADDLKFRYFLEKSRYTDTSQRIDSSFVKRLLGNNSPVHERNEYLLKINNLKEIIDNYQRFGLISNYEKDNIVSQYDDKFGTVLSLYIDDMFEKIAVYKRFYDQLSAFYQFVNGKGLSNKSMFLDESKGISFRSDSERNIPLEKLSSGEQNLIILYYRLVFETKPNTLLLIDEPENSIHVEWLEKMLEDYFAISRDLKCQMIIATHSPTFIGDNFNVAYDLYGGSYQDWMK